MQPPKITPRATIWLNSTNNTWPSMEAVIRATKGKPVKISGTTLDLNGCQISGTKLPQPDHEDDEDGIPLRINIKGFRMHNGSTRGIPGGIVFRREKVTFEDIVFLDTVEDSISNIMDDSADATIRRCKFFGASDKSVQMNDARGLTFDDNIIVGGITGVRLQKKGGKYKKPKTKSLKGNRFINVDTAWNLSGEIQATGSGNIYSGVDKRVDANTGAKFSGT